MSNSIAEMIHSHLAPWRRALLCVLGVAANDHDADNVNYYKHEIKALDDIERVVHSELAAEVVRLIGLRALRLYHYQAMLRLRTYAADADMRDSDSKHYNKRANFHLGFVQTLNEFFPIGDTAERDNDNATNL